MHRSRRNSEAGPVTEMAIVDTFTKLIFGDEDFSERQSMIVEAFRVVNPDVLRDSYPEMGEYLRSLGVREMIQLVSRVREHIACHGDNTKAVLPEHSATAAHLRPTDPTRS